MPGSLTSMCCGHLEILLKNRLTQEGAGVGLEVCFSNKLPWLPMLLAQESYFSLQPSKAGSASYFL